MQILRPHCRITESKSLGVEARNMYFDKLTLQVIRELLGSTPRVFDSLCLSTAEESSFELLGTGQVCVYIC